MASFAKDGEECGGASSAGVTTIPEDELDEFFLCARYGELSEVRSAVEKYGNVIGGPSTRDDNGNTALHFAAANGHVPVVAFLIGRCGAKCVTNGSGNTPLHWAVLNKQKNVVDILCRSVDDVDVLQQNDNGKGAVTLAFGAGVTEVTKILLEHPSAAKLNEAASASPSTVEKEEDGGDGDDAVAQKHTHQFLFESDTVRIQEVGLMNDGAAEEGNLENTGAALWGASLLLARWMLARKSDIEGKAVAELGAGCALPGVVAHTHCAAARVVVTDLESATFSNTVHNVEVNRRAEDPPRIIEALPIDWMKAEEWPEDVRGAFDVIVGSDLVYDADLVPHLLGVILAMIKPGGKFLYVSGKESRDGLPTFVASMKKVGFSVCATSPPPQEYFANALESGNDDAFDLIFGELKTNTFALYEFTLAKK